MLDFLLLTGVQVFLAVTLDLIFGKVTRWHPLATFGQLANRLEERLYLDTTNPKQRFLPGVLATVAAIIPFAGVAWFLVGIPVLGWLIEVVILYFVIGGRNLVDQARSVSMPLMADDLEEARTRTGGLINRQTNTFTPAQMIRITMESVLENGNHAVFGALFWFTVAGAPGVVIYRLTNTLNTMWNYKNTRFLYFGRPAARLDETLNWIPTRLTALTYAMQGYGRAALTCCKQQADLYKSSNGGVVIAAGAGALGCVLGDQSVDGKEIEGPALGCGRQPNILDIERSVSLVNMGTWIWVAGIFLVGTLL